MIRLTSLTALLSLVVALAACGPPPPPPRLAIVILLDAARADRFSCYGYERQTTPHMDALAQRGAVFLRHFSQGTTTRAALPTLLYSRYFALPVFPASSAVPLTEPGNLFRRWDDASVSLPAAVSADGFRTAAISAHVWLRDETRFVQEFDELVELPAALDEGHVSADAAQVVDAALDWIGRHADRDALLYLHVMDTHFPHEFGPDAARFFGDRPAPVERFSAAGRPRDTDTPLTPDERDYLDALYDGSLAATDREIGRLVDALDAAGRLEATSIVVTADHGEHLMEVPGRFAHGGAWYDAVAHIPLIVFSPGEVQPQRSDALTDLVDVMPTLLRVLDVDLPSGKALDGIDLLSEHPALQREAEYAFFERGVRGRDGKLLLGKGDEQTLSDGTTPQGLSYFDLRADPHELQDVADSHPAQVEALLEVYRDRLERPYRRFVESVSNVQPKLAFAIAPRDMIFAALPAAVAPQRLATACEEPGGGWMLCRRTIDNWLLATQGAPPLKMGIAIPAGPYRVTLNVVGQGLVRLGVSGTGGDAGVAAEHALDGGAFSVDGELRGTDVSLGEVQIRDGVFRMSLAPVGDGCLLLRRVGFEPLLPGVDPGASDDERLERLRELGYVR
ncbi:MAG: hypothetical protein DRQ55_08765 [Planctomycetota bacterium]|nr:MAG: hypothetical protein DRQ55_08765 [Planctomycetota bacterium]